MASLFVMVSVCVGVQGDHKTFRLPAAPINSGQKSALRYVAMYRTAAAAADASFSFCPKSLASTQAIRILNYLIFISTL